MRDKIDQLESNNPVGIAPGGMFSEAGDDKMAEADMPAKLDKLRRKLKTKETEAKQLKSDLLDSKNKLSKVELKLVKVEAQLREAKSGQTEESDKANLLQNRIKELEIEKEMLLQRQRDAIRSQDAGHEAINKELDKMREEFAHLKV